MRGRVRIRPTPALPMTMPAPAARQDRAFGCPPGLALHDAAVREA